jgi:hypothetical protein
MIATSSNVNVIEFKFIVACDNLVIVGDELFQRNLVPDVKPYGQKYPLVGVDGFLVSYGNAFYEVLRIIFCRVLGDILIKSDLREGYLTVLCISVAFTSSKSISLNISLSSVFWRDIRHQTLSSQEQHFRDNYATHSALHSYFHAVIIGLRSFLISYGS